MLSAYGRLRHAHNYYTVRLVADSRITRAVGILEITRTCFTQYGGPFGFRVVWMLDGCDLVWVLCLWGWYLDN